MMILKLFKFDGTNYNWYADIKIKDRNEAFNYVLSLGENLFWEVVE